MKLNIEAKKRKPKGELRALRMSQAEGGQGTMPGKAGKAGKGGKEQRGGLVEAGGRSGPGLPEWEREGGRPPGGAHPSAAHWPLELTLGPSESSCSNSAAKERDICIRTLGHSRDPAPKSSSGG